MGFSPEKRKRWQVSFKWRSYHKRGGTGEGGGSWKKKKEGV